MKIRTLAAAAAMTLAAAASQASLVTNGSFESGLTGWSCVASPGSCATGDQGPAAQDGVAYFYGFDNSPPEGVLSQNLATEAGASYRISLYFNTNGGVPPNALSRDVGDLSEPLALVTGSWEHFTGTFTAAGASTDLNLLFTTVGGSGTVWVDNVVVDRIPEPTGVALAALGLLGLAATRRSRR